MRQEKLALKDLQQMMIRQLRRRGYYPLKEHDILLRLGEEIGEVFEAIRENQPERNVAHEMADVFWMLLILADKRRINLEKAFLEKHGHNESRPLKKLKR